VLGEALQSLPDTPRTGNRGRESGIAGICKFGHRQARQCVAQSSFADTPHPFAGAAVCSAGPRPVESRLVMLCSAVRSKHAAHLRVRGSLQDNARHGAVRQGVAMHCSTRRASSGARKWARRGMDMSRAAMLSAAWPGMADTQRPAMAVAVCAARRGMAQRSQPRLGAARQGAAKTSG